MAATVIGGRLSPPTSLLRRKCRFWLGGRKILAVQQQRWYWDHDASRKNFDKPAVTGSKHIFIRAQVPVVLLEPVRGLGPKGKIVNVKRGYARHFLVPKGLAVFGTWENIDEFADPALVDDPLTKAREVVERGRLPFDWVDEIRMRFVRWARDDQPKVLLEPITQWDVLEELSVSHELDLLPGNLTMPEGGIVDVGMHEIAAKIAFRNPEAAAGKYTMFLEVVSQQSLEEDLRRDEMARNVAESIRFQLPERGGAVDFAGGLEADEEDIGGLDDPP